jgi:hypothetical protein
MEEFVDVLISSIALFPSTRITSTPSRREPGHRGLFGDLSFASLFLL